VVRELSGSVAIEALCRWVLAMLELRGTLADSRWGKKTPGYAEVSSAAAALMDAHIAANQVTMSSCSAPPPPYTQAYNIYYCHDYSQVKALDLEELARHLPPSKTGSLSDAKMAMTVAQTTLEVVTNGGALNGSSSGGSAPKKGEGRHTNSGREAKRGGGSSSGSSGDHGAWSGAAATALAKGGKAVDNATIDNATIDNATIDNATIDRASSTPSASSGATAQGSGRAKGKARMEAKTVFGDKSKGGKFTRELQRVQVLRGVGAIQVPSHALVRAFSTCI
jgi:hypothetical protein